LWKINSQKRRYLYLKSYTLGTNLRIAKNIFSMEIPEIKQRLTLSMVLQHYGLKADKSHRINCPFHEDKTPSMQLY